MKLMVLSYNRPIYVHLIWLQLKQSFLGHFHYSSPSILVYIYIVILDTVKFLFHLFSWFENDEVEQE